MSYWAIDWLYAGVSCMMNALRPLLFLFCLNDKITSVQVIIMSLFIKKNMCRHIGLLMYCLSVDKFKYHDKHVHQTLHMWGSAIFSNKRLRKLFLSYLPQFELYSFLAFIGYEFIVIPYKNQLKISR